MPRPAEGMLRPAEGILYSRRKAEGRLDFVEGMLRPAEGRLDPVESTPGPLA